MKFYEVTYNPWTIQVASGRPPPAKYLNGCLEYFQILEISQGTASFPHPHFLPLAAAAATYLYSTLQCTECSPHLASLHSFHQLLAYSDYLHLPHPKAEPTRLNNGNPHTYPCIYESAETPCRLILRHTPTYYGQ
jgi:hypothetical protein